MRVQLLSSIALAISSTAFAADTADIRVIHASPDAPNVDVWVNGGLAFTDIPFAGSTSYAGLAAGSYNIQVVPAGETEPAVIDVDVTLDAGIDYSVVAINELAAIEPLVLVDDNTLDLDNARVRFVHTSPNAPAVDIAVTNGPVLFAGVDYTEIGDYLTLAPGTVDLEVRVADTETVVLELPGIVLEAATDYTVFAMGLVGETPELQAIITVDNALGLAVDAPFPAMAGMENTLRISGAYPNSYIALVYGIQEGPTPIRPCNDQYWGIIRPWFGGIIQVDATGQAALNDLVPASAEGRDLFFQAFDANRCDLSNVSAASF